MQSIHIPCAIWIFDKRIKKNEGYGKVSFKLMFYGVNRSPFFQTIATNTIVIAAKYVRNKGI